MTRSTDDLDNLIRSALGSADRELLDRLGDNSMTDLLTAVFRGRHRRLAIGGAVVNLVLFVAGIMSAVQFLLAADERAMLHWGGAMLLCFGAVAVIKIWYWLEMNRLAVTREVKRVELQLVRITQSTVDRQAE